MGASLSEGDQRGFSDASKLRNFESAPRSLLDAPHRKTQIYLEHAVRHVLKYTKTSAEYVVLAATQGRLALTHVSNPALRRSVVFGRLRYTRFFVSYRIVRKYATCN